MSTIGTRSSQGLGVGSRAFPTVPTNVIAYRSTLTSTIISWSPPLVNGNGVVSSYRVEFSTDGSTWSLVGNTSNLTLTHSGLNDSVSSLYRYRVSATNSAGFGPSKTLTGTVQIYGGPGNWTVPAGVTKASVVVVGGGSDTGGGGGGGGGGVAVGYGLDVSGTIPYVVGPNGVNGGFSSSFGTTVLTATGGSRTLNANGGPSGVGGGTGANILASTSKPGGSGQFSPTFTGGGGGAQTAGGNAISPNGGAGGLGYTFLGLEKLGGGGGGYGTNGNVIGAHDGRGSGANAQSSSQQGKFGAVAIQYFV
jgi:hypothetical protein